MSECMRKQQGQIKCRFNIIFIRVPKNPSSIAELFLVIIESLRVRVEWNPGPMGHCVPRDWQYILASGYGNVEKVMLCLSTQLLAEV